MNIIDQSEVLQDVKDSLRVSAIELSRWKLLKSSKWSAEALRGIAKMAVTNDANSTSNETHQTMFNDRETIRVPKEDAGFTEDEFDLYILASSLFDSKELERCAFFLADVTEPRLKFLKLYCQYLSWDKKSVESVESILVTGKVSGGAGYGESDEFMHSFNMDALTNNSDIIKRFHNGKDTGIQCMKDGHQSSVALILQELRDYMEKYEENLSNSQEGELGLALLYYLKGVLLNQNGEKSQALSSFIHSLTLYSFNWTCWVELLECISRADESVLILKHLSEQLVLSKHNNRGSQQYPDHNIMVKFFKIAVFQEFSGNLEEYMANLDFLLSILPNFAYLKAQNALVYYNHMDYTNSESIFDEIIKVDPYRVDDLDTYSNILYVMQKQAKLAYLAQFVSQIDRFRPETCSIIANYYSARQEHEKSIMYFRRALILNKKSTSAWTLMGHEFVELKNSQSAIECYRRAVDINPRDFRAWYGLGQAYEVLDMHMYSLYYFQKACALKPLDRRMWQAVAFCYSKLKSTDSAIKSYQRALQVSNTPDQDIAILYRLACEYESIKDIEMCKSYMTRCIESENTNEEVVTEESIRAKLWLAKYELQIQNYEKAYEYAISITNGTSQEVEEARAIARNCRMQIK
ncbi:anaphase promoting complex subunit [Maudiozyma humilis]|uniref:Anaphase promoting complex subunit n=1 Tax=Maudiozyma humilis TaxID=51915 RepID=A0AAV5S5E6_MAUHU|nr:anaphase promoting complex subunit [Kazachstania humilis]